MPKRPRIVVVGAGFGGLQAAQSLAGSGADVLLIDRNNYHTFVPLLYQVATAQLLPDLVAYPVRTILRRRSRTQFLMAEVRRIDFAEQMIETDDAVIPYNFLVLATGSQTRFLDIPGASDYTFSIRTLEEAVTLRNHLFDCFERAAQEYNPVRREQLLTFAIVGGGATGVEMAGALVEMLHGLRRDYPTLAFQTMRLILVQSSDRLLPDLPAHLGAYTAKRLRQLGVEVHLQTKVSQVTPGTVHLQEEQVIKTATVIWTAGLEASAPETSEDLSTAAKGKLLVRPTLQLLDYPNVYAIGDLAFVKTANTALVGVAPEALQQGVAVARNIKRQLRGQSACPFRYFNKGRLAIIGCFSGVGKIGAISLTGFIAWLMWLSVHLIYLPGYRSRAVVLLSWLHTYLLGDRAVRLILSPKPLSAYRSKSQKTKLSLL